MFVLWIVPNHYSCAHTTEQSFGNIYPMWFTLDVVISFWITELKVREGESELAQGNKKP